MRQFALVLVTLCLLISTRSGASAEAVLDCSHPAGRDQLALCNADVARKDQVLDQAFETLAQQPDMAKGAAEAGRKFAAARADCGSDLECIRIQQDAVLGVLARIADPKARSAGDSIGPRPRILTPYSPQFLDYMRAKPPPKPLTWSEAFHAFVQTYYIFLYISFFIIAFASFCFVFRRRISAEWLGYRQRASANRAFREMRRERRRQTRFRRGKLFDLEGRLLMECTISDRSPSGAKIRIDKTLVTPHSLRFVDEVEQIVFEAGVAWRRGNELGLQFRK